MFVCVCVCVCIEGWGGGGGGGGVGGRALSVQVLTQSLPPHRTSLQFTESTASDASRPSSVISLDSSASDLRDLIGTSVSRSSSGRSAGETRDIVMSTLGEPTEFLPIKMIAPEILRDVQEELLPICEEYQKVMVSTFVRNNGYVIPLVEIVI